MWNYEILNKYMESCAQRASTEETTHNTTHVQPHKITKIKTTRNRHNSFKNLTTTMMYIQTFAI